MATFDAPSQEEFDTLKERLARLMRFLGVEEAKCPERRGAWECYTSCETCGGDSVILVKKGACPLERGS